MDEQPNSIIASYKQPGKPILDPRHAAAEITAAAALIFIQHVATWEGLHAVALAAEAGNEREVLELLKTLTADPIQSVHAVTYLEILDHAARAWAHLAHGPHAANRTPADLLQDLNAHPYPAE